MVEDNYQMGPPKVQLSVRERSKNSYILKKKNNNRQHVKKYQKEKEGEYFGRFPTMMKFYYLLTLKPLPLGRFLSAHSRRLILLRKM